MSGPHPREDDGAGHLAVLAGVPRPAGSDAERRARAYCAATLEELGFELTEIPFAYSSIPGRWATPAAGVLSAVAFTTSATLGRAGHATAALGALLGVLAVVALGGFWMARHGTVRLPAGRASAVNLEARPRPYGKVTEPRVWLVAHLDSKSQPVPMLLRAGGVMATAIAWAAMLALGVASQVGPGAAWLWAPLGAIGVVAALPIMACTVGARSAGALDNASGVASVLGAAALAPRTRPIGVLLTSAEELGLAGAREWVRGRTDAGRTVLINCDGVDDDGGLVLMYSGRRPDRLLDTADRVAAEQGLAVRGRRLLSGVLVDAVAFADAGYETVTLSRGTPRTLLRIHRPHDDLAHLRGAGIGEASRLLAALATDLARD